MRLLLGISVLAVMSVSTASARKERRWETGKLLDMHQSSVVGTAIGATNIRLRGFEMYVIEAGEYIYESREVRMSPTPLLTVNGPVLFAIEKDHVYIKDEKGKEHNTDLIKKTLRTPTEK